MTMKTKTTGIALFLFTTLCFTAFGQNLSDFRVRLNETGNTRTISVIAYTGVANDITIPARINDVPIRIIERGAFQSLTSLTRVTFPFGVTTIESGAFNGCSALVSLFIPATVTSIGAGAFNGCSSLTAIEVDPRNQQYHELEGVLFDKAGTTLLYYPSGKIGDYSVPDSVKNVAPGAFIDADKLSLESCNEIAQRFGSVAFGAPSGQSPVTPSNSVSSVATGGVASSVVARRSQGPVLPGRSRSVYYVSAQGNDANNGLSEAAPFRTLWKAIEATATGAVRTITVIGRVEGGFILNNISGELLITGKPNATDTEKASIAVSSGLVLQVNGFTKLRLEHIEITGGNMGGIRIDDGAFLTLGTGARVSGNAGANGGGVNVHGQNTTLVMEGNATITDNIANAGGGVFIWEKGTLVMKNIATITGNRVIQGVGEYGRGGGVFIQDAYFIMQDSAEVSGNRTFAGGGLFALRSNVTMRDSAVIKDNSSEVVAGGAYFHKGVLLMEGNSEISGNSAATNGGGVELESIKDGNGSTVLLRESARITNNSAAMRGGGLFIGGNNRVVLQDDAEISGNQAKNGGGVREEQGASLILDTTAGIRNNTASEYPDISRIH